MIKLDVKVNNVKVEELLKRQRRQLQMLPTNALIEFKTLTPIGKPETWKSPPPKNYVPGNARRSTKLVNNDTIEANYPYAVRLDEGWSRQAPKGMIEPFKQWLAKQIQKISRK